MAVSGFLTQTQAALTEGRALAESLMTDTATVRYKTSQTVQNARGQEEAVYAVRFTSKCKLQSNNRQATDPDVGGRRDPIDALEIHLPVSAGQVYEGDVVEITAVGSLSDVRSLGRKFVVASPMNKTYATATRLSVKELP